MSKVGVSSIRLGGSVLLDTLLFENFLIVEAGDDLQIEFPYDRQRDLFIAFNCQREISHRSF